MDNGNVSGNVDTAILLRCRKAEDVVVFVDCATYSAQRVVAVGHRVREGEFLQTAGARRLYDTDVSDVVGHHCIELNAHFITLTSIYIVCTQDVVSDGVFPCFIGCGKTLCVFRKFRTVE